MAPRQMIAVGARYDGRCGRALRIHGGIARRTAGSGTDAMRHGFNSSVHSCESQRADAVLMVRPAAFDYNPQTAASNSMQRTTLPGTGDVHEAARVEFEGVVAALRAERVRVCVAEDTPEPLKPDAVFPNNWVSFHADGTVVIYPLAAQSRRCERRSQVLEQAVSELGFRVRRTLDLTRCESAGGFLEGTGSLVLDRANRIAYACRSPRTDETVLHEWSREMGYRPVLFSAHDARGRAIYHTNVMMSIGVGFVVVAAESIFPEDRGRVLESLGAGGREILTIGQRALAAFAANVLELGRSGSGSGRHGVLVMSTTAAQALGAQNLAQLEACVGRVLTVRVPTIETLGGGGVRCMLAEVFSEP